MQYTIKIQGIRPLLMHNGAAGLDTGSVANIEKAEIARKKGTNRTEADNLRIQELECQTSLWLDVDGAPSIPEGAIRSMIEKSARKLKQGPQVREGLIVDRVLAFDYDKEKLGTTVEELGKQAQFSTNVVVQRSRIIRTRAKFDHWSCTFVIDADDELVDKTQIESWLDIGGRRIGLGDWRPACSGNFGRFELVSIESSK